MSKSIAVNKVELAFELVKKKYGTLPTICGLLNVSSTYIYASIQRGEISLPGALKLDALLEGEVTWQELCPRIGRDVNSVLERASKL